MNHKNSKTLLDATPHFHREKVWGVSGVRRLFVKSREDFVKSREEGGGQQSFKRETPGGNVGVTSHQRNVRCGLID